MFLLYSFTKDPGRLGISREYCRDQPNLYTYIKTAASTPTKPNPKNPLTPVETAPPPLEGDPVPVGVPLVPDLVDDPDWVDEVAFEDGGWP